MCLEPNVYPRYYDDDRTMLTERLKNVDEGVVFYTNLVVLSPFIVPALASTSARSTWPPQLPPSCTSSSAGA